MLVLSRKLREQIQIGDHVTVTILRVKGNAVRLGIEAPRDVKVVRKELPPEVTERVSAQQRANEQARDDRQAVSASKASTERDSMAAGVGAVPSHRTPTAIPVHDQHVAVFVSDPHRDHVVEIKPSGNLNSLKQSSSASPASGSAAQDDSDAQEADSESGAINRVAHHLRRQTSMTTKETSAAPSAGLERLRQIVAAVSESNS